MKDKKLEDLLNEARRKKPTEIRVMSWKKAVRSEVERLQSHRRFSFWSDLSKIAAGLVLGFFIGSYFSNKVPEPEESTATYEVIYDKRG